MAVDVDNEMNEPLPERRTLGTAKGDFVVPNDFDAPLPDDVLDAFEGLNAAERRLLH